jgi:cell division protein FtsB
MGLMAEIKARGRHVIGPALAVCVSGYFGYHVFHGERGMTAWVDLQKTVETLNKDYEAVKAEREALERRVSLLKPGSLDPDMLDERARRMLNYGGEREVVILLGPDGRLR